MDRRHELPSHPMPEPLRLRHHSRRSEVARKVTGCAFLTCPSRSPTPALILTSLGGIGRPLVRPPSGWLQRDGDLTFGTENGGVRLQRARRNRATRSEIRPTRSSRLGGASPISTKK